MDGPLDDQVLYLIVRGSLLHPHCYSLHFDLNGLFQDISAHCG